MTPEHAFKLRAGDTVHRETPPPFYGTVLARRGHLLFIRWGTSEDQYVLTYDAGPIERAEDPAHDA
jgi:hypothetical protein